MSEKKRGDDQSWPWEPSDLGSPTQPELKPADRVLSDTERELEEYRVSEFDGAILKGVLLDCHALDTSEVVQILNHHAAELRELQELVGRGAKLMVKLPAPLPEQRKYVQELLDWEARSYKPDAMIGGPRSPKKENPDE